MKKIFALIGLLGATAWILRRWRLGAMQPPPPVVPPNNELYVADMGSNRIFCFEIGANGRVTSTPWRTIDGFNNSITGLVNPFDLAVTDAGEIWVANLGGQPGGSQNTPSVTIYDAAASGVAAPTFVIRPSLVGPLFVSPIAVAWRESADTFLLIDHPRAKILECTKAQDATGSIVELGMPAGLAVGGSGKLFVSDQTPGHHAILMGTLQIHVFEQTLPSRIEGPLTQLNNPAHIAVDPQERVYVVNRGSLNPYVQDASIAVFAANVNGDVAPVQYIYGANSELIDPYGIAVDTTGRIFVTTARRVLVFAPGATGNVAPAQKLTLDDFSSLIGVEVR